jgi:hypothetical protein
MYSIIGSFPSDQFPSFSYDVQVPANSTFTSLAYAVFILYYTKSIYYIYTLFAQLSIIPCSLRIKVIYSYAFDDIMLKDIPSKITHKEIFKYDYN